MQRTALVTGAAGGIGAALAVALAHGGGRVLVADLDASGAAEVCRRLPGEGHRAVALDVADAAAWARLAADLDGLDLLIHNAGVTVHGPFAAQSSEDLAWLNGVNLLGPQQGTAALLPLLRRSAAGHVVFVSSMAALFPVPLQTSYAASKAGLRAFAASLRVELAHEGVGVTCVLPGTIATDFLRHGRSHHPASSRWMADKMRWGGASPERVARATLLAVARGRGEVRVGLDCHAVAAVQALCPPLLPWLLRLGLRQFAGALQAQP